MIKLKSGRLSEILNCTAPRKEVEIWEVSTDSRAVSEHSLFIALKGERFDAHDFVAEVINSGCPLVVVDHLISDVPAEKQLVVDDTLQAFGKIGAYVRRQFKGKVIGITGSAGKTTTKEEIAFLLSKFAPTYATFGNFNNHIGVPRSLCDIDMNAEYAVIEMGMSAKGEIEYLVNLVKPDIAVVTNVYPMHIEFFNNFAEIAYAKAEIFSGLPPQNGIAVINEDTNFADILHDEARKHNTQIVWFGKNKHPDIKFNLTENGEQHLYNAWCALSVVQALGLDVEKAAQHIQDFATPEGRGKHYVLKLAKGGTYTLIDDSYSGQPEAMKLGLIALNKVNCQGRKIAVLGKMAELGDTSQKRHIEIGQLLSDSSVDIVVGVCSEMQDMLNQLPKTKEQYYFENKDNVADFLLNKLLQNNDIVFIKGARHSSKLYQVAAELLKKGV